MSTTTNSLFTDEHLEALNRLTCKVLLQAKEMVDYIEGSGKQVSEKSGGTNKKKKGNDQGKNKKLTARWDLIGRWVYGENKLTLSDLLAGINNKIMASYSMHREEEDTAITSLEEITRKLQTLTQQAANWRQQIEWDKGVDGAAGTENRIEEREKIKLATDWAKKDAKWIKQYNNQMFDLRRAQEVKNAKALPSKRLFRKWKGVEWRKYAERYGSIVLLDPLWNPTAFGHGNQTANFASYMNYQLQKPLLK
ncbi:hypothetical protein BDN71DRAFT_1435596 [Pleurotus eryngii]|uniref:Uncharacterized protein n=1 Tax=Pleurotus eryngii TaxID=5323 RepID=A0A9P6D9Y8_PLEER|nr:hypothetical protein BDN71DRAFT_1435596 [Pleurotus eryngii]